MAVFRPFRAFRPLPVYQALIPAPPYDVLTAAGARARQRAIRCPFYM